ncbi:hypothetical protein AcV5_003079 [Taiwanofungus camphoratus]|nr:hypothetical protein AcV5_003079 [Antrodia cinnamomea]
MQALRTFVRQQVAAAESRGPNLPAGTGSHDARGRSESAQYFDNPSLDRTRTCTVCISAARRAQIRRVPHEHPQSIGIQSHLELLTVIYFAEETEEVTRSVLSSSFQFDRWASKAVPEYHRNRSFSKPR